MRRTVLLVVLALVLAGCASGRDGTSSGDVTVLAAASLTDALTAVGEAYEQAGPPGTAPVRVRFAFAGSQRLASQVIDGAPADVFASADAVQMDRVVDAGLAAEEPVAFVHNDLVIAVAPGNPAGITEVADLADPGLAVVLAAEEVPAGRYTARLLETVDVDISPVSREPNVRAVVARVALGEADAGIVYTSDVVAAGGDVHRVRIPPADNVAVSYPIVALRDAANPVGAAAFVDYVQSRRARRVFSAHGLRLARPS